jgi:transcriptional regulator with PAS, ATPase and Fis domain
MTGRGALPVDTPLDRAVAIQIARGDMLLAIGNGKLLSHRLAGDEVVIGRDAGCDFVIEHHSLSRRHARFRLLPRPTIQDLGSTNGTRIEGQTLRAGDPVELTDAGFRIGPYSFIVIAHGAAARPSSPSSIRDHLVVVDPTSAGVPSLVRSFAEGGTNIIITGETGVGKEVLAATIHDLSGRTGTFVRINCAALSETLLEGELFGHEKGSFTGATAPRRGLIEAASGGTLLLDEIGELPLGTQAKLLRVIERREVLRIGSTQPIAVDVRFIAATHRDLVAEVGRGGFRADLFYRLDGVTLSIPPLRERRGAIVPLAIQFFEAARPAGAPPVALGADVVAALEAHAWPGNVRELKAVMERAAVIAGPGAPSVSALTFARSAPVAPPAPASAPASTVAAEHTAGPGSDLDPAQLAERDQILRALSECAGNQSRAARRLGISRTTLINRIRIYRIRRPLDLKKGS